MQNYPLRALAYLGLARAYTLEAGSAGVLQGRSTAVPAAMAGAPHSRKGEQSGGQDVPPTPGQTLPRTLALQKARAAYQDFFALWKDADPDIPVLEQAKKEYARLQ